MSNQLTEIERAVLTRYMTAHNEADCHKMNESLRQGIAVKQLPQDQREVAENIECAISKQCPVSEQIIVHRGIRARLKLTCEEKYNREFQTLGFWSTSTDKMVASNFVGDFRGGSYFRIKIQPGCRVLFTKNLLDQNIPGLGENEVLLPRNLRLRIDGNETHDEYKVVLDVASVDILNDVAVYDLVGLPNESD